MKKLFALMLVVLSVSAVAAPSQDDAVVVTAKKPIQLAPHMGLKEMTYFGEDNNLESCTGTCRLWYSDKNYVPRFVSTGLSVIPANPKAPAK